MAQQIEAAIVILRRKQVEARCGLSRSALYRRIGQGSFPRPITLAGGRAVGWIEREIDEFLARCVAQRDQRAAK